jgi:FAD/FMN-containing dehydrogenase
MPTDADDLLRHLAATLGPQRICTGAAALAPYATMPWVRLRPRQEASARLGMPAGVVRPASSEEVATVLAAATAAGVAVVPYGAGTGVMGGALPVAGGIVLDLGALDRIVAMEPVDRTARVQAGVVLGDLAQAAAARGLLFAHDPWSQPIATVGGAVSTNGMGYLAAGYGSMGDQVLGLDVVLPTGQILSWPGAAKGAGPALWKLFVGAEGALGVITGAVVQLFPQPPARALLAYRFPSFADGFTAIDRVIGADLRPVMVDFEERTGPPLHSPADLYLAFDGPPAVIGAAAREATRLCRAAGGSQRTPAAAQRFWDERHASAEWFREQRAEQVAPTRPRPERRGMLYVDVAVPIARGLDYCAMVVEAARAGGVTVRSFGVWARPELLSFILEGPTAPLAEGAGPGPLDQVLDEVLSLARALGGSIEYCHGVGARLSHLLPTELGAAYPLLQRLKAALDPAEILNPGKLASVPPG